MTLDQILVVLKARWHTVLITFLVVVAVAVALTLAMPRYEATAVLAVEIGGSDPVGGQPLVSRTVGEVSNYIATQADIIRSEVVAIGALRGLRLHEDAGWQERWTKSAGGEGDYQAWIAEQLLRRLEVRPSRDSNIITVAYTSPNPEVSAAVVNAFVRSYSDTTLQMRAAPARQFNAFFEERAKPLRAALEDARSRLSAYEKQHGITVGDEPDVESARLAELSSQLVTLQDAATEASSLRKQANASPAATREVRNDPEVAVLTGELVRLESQLAELKSDFGERHQSVVQARQSISDARRRLDAAMRRIADSLAAPSKVVEARLAETRAAVARQRELVLKRKAQRDAAASLRRDVENAEKAYGAVIARASQTALESANTTPTSVSVLKTATPPLWKADRLLRVGLVAALLGLLLGIARAMLAERRDRRLRTLEDVTQRLRQPLLLSLPDGDKWWRGDDANQTRQRLVSTRPRLTGPR